MGIIKKIYQDIKGVKTVVYPITKTKAVFDDAGKTLDLIIQKITDESGGYYVGTTPPENTFFLWVNSTDGKLYYYSNKKWASLSTNVYHIGTTAPADTKLLWLNSNDSTLYYYNGSSWLKTRSGGYYVGSAAPTNTDLLWVNTSNKIIYYHNGTSWVQSETTGYYVGASAPSNTKILWLNSTNNVLQYHNGTKWVTTESNSYHVATTAPTDTKLLWVNSNNNTINYYNGSTWVGIVDQQLRDDVTTLTQDVTTHLTPGTITTSGNTANVSPAVGGNFKTLQVSKDSKGHVTAVNERTVTLPVQTTITGNAGTATKLQTSRNINITGDGTATGKFDGSADLTLSLTTRTVIAVGSDSANSAGWYKVASSTLSGYNNQNILFSVYDTYFTNNNGILRLKVRVDNTSITINSLGWLIRHGFNENDICVVVSGLTWTLYVKTTSPQWGRIFFEVLSSSSQSDKNTTITYYDKNSTKETTDPVPTVSASDIGIAKSAKQLLTAVNIHGVSFDGTSDITIPNASTTISGVMSASDKSKLDGIAMNANNYTHPNSGITAGTYKSVTVNAQGHVTAGTNPTTLAGYGITDAAPLSHVGTGGASHANASTTVDGFMSASDKSKLDGIAVNANNYTHPNSGVTASTYRSVTVNAQGHVTGGTNPTTLAGYGITDAAPLAHVGVGGVAHANVTTTVDGFMSYQDKVKLDGIATNANNYTHPTSGASAGTYTSVTINTLGHVTAGTNPTTLAGYGITDATPSSHIGTGGASHANATTSVDGFMSASDKSKLDGIATNANNYTHPNSGVTAGSYQKVTVNAQGHVTGGTNPTTLSGYGITDAAPLSHVGTGGAAHANVSTTVDGFMSYQDKVKLDGIDVGANNYTHPTSGATAGTYRSVTVNAQGHVTGGTNPTTLSGYGITDAAPLSHVGTGGTAHANATTSVDGFMSAADKSKLDGVATNANNYTHPNSGVTAGSYQKVTVNAQGHVTGGTNPTTLSGYGITDATPSSHIGSGGAAHANATTSVDGFMSATDKTKLDGHLTPGTITTVGNTANVSPSAGGNFKTLQVSRDSNGHITAINERTVTLPVQTTVSGNSGTATKLQTARNINITGDGTATGKFDGSADLNLDLTTRTTVAVGSDNTSSGGWYKVATSTPSGYGNQNIVFAVYDTYSNHNTGILNLKVRSDNTQVAINTLGWLVRYGFKEDDVCIVLDGMTWTLYVKRWGSQYGRIFFEVLSMSSINGKNINVTYFDGNNTVETASPIPTVSASDIGISNAAKQLLTARTIQGVAFDGTKNITLPTATSALDGLMSKTDKSNLDTAISNISSITTDLNTHLTPGATTTVGNTSNVSPSIGGNFKTLQVSRDSKGHITTINERTVTLPVQTTVSGNAGTATKLQTARTIELIGALEGSGTFDGSSNLSIATKPTHSDYRAFDISQGSGYIKLITFEVTSNYANAPITFDLYGRSSGIGCQDMCRVFLRLANSGGTTPEISIFKYLYDSKYGNNIIAYVNSSGTNTLIEIWCLGAEWHDTIYLKNLSVPNRFNVTYGGEYSATEPVLSGYTKYTPTKGTIAANISGDASTVNGYTVNSNVPSGAKFTDTTYGVATTSANGLMSSTDKSKLDNVEANANNYSHPNSGVTAGSYQKVTVNAQGHVTGGTNPTTLSGFGITDAAPLSHVGTGGAAHANATTSVDGFMAAADKSKLDGIAANANNYSHPNSGVTANTYRSVTVNAQGHVTGGTNPTTLSGYGITDATPSSHIGSSGTAHANVTTTVDGFMSAADKVKLNGIEANANNYTHPGSGVTAGTYRSVTVNAAGHVTSGANPTTLSGYGITDATPSSHIGTGGASHANATTSVDGFMSAADKTKLNGIATGANNYTLPVAGTAIGGVKSGGGITVDSSGNVTVNDNGHNHTASNITDLQALLNAKVNKAGDTLTGNLTFTMFGSTKIPVKIYGGDANGQGLSIGAGAATIISSGEGCDVIEANHLATNETMIVGSDNTTVFYTNLQNGWDNRKYMTMESNGKLSNDNGFVGNLTGNSDTATKLQTARKINGVSFDGTADINFATNQALQSASTTASYRPLVLGATNTTNSTDSLTGTVTGQTYVAQDLYTQPSTGTLGANVIAINRKANMQYNADLECIEFVFM